MTRRAEQRQIKETQLIDAAQRVVREKGFAAARMADVAREAGISYGLVYHYFGSKEAVFAAISDRWWTPLFDFLEDLERGAQPLERQLKDLTDYFLHMYRRNPDLVHVVITELSRSHSHLTSSQLANFQNLISAVERLIAKAQRVDQLRRDVKARYLATAFLGAVETFLTSMVLVNQPIANDHRARRMADGILDIFFNGAKPGVAGD